MSKVNVDELTGTLFGLQAVVSALMASHPDQKRLLEAINATGAATLAMLSTTPASETTRAAARAVVEKARKRVEAKVQSKPE
jgi:hypothetical protein